MTELFVNKYQPLYFDDFLYSKDVINILNKLMMINELNILLIGDMSSGKTTIINALVREYYHGYSIKEYEENILYINNLSEQGINYYRTDVKIFCQTFSTIRGKKKTIVLDDIDLINEQSQQVFRNFIDECKNVNFICSCSNNQKVIESLQSRLNIIKINMPKKENINEIINYIKTKENIIIDNDAQEFIINISNNVVKVVINYMEKFKLINERITLDIAIKLCSNISFLKFEKYTKHILSNEIFDAIEIIYELYDNGYSVMDILDNYFSFVKITTILTEEQKYIVIAYLCKYITIFHNIHEDEIELPFFTNNLIKTLNCK